MIIGDLAKAYDRLAEDEECGIARDGYCDDLITDFLSIDTDGRLIEIITPEKPLTQRLPENPEKNATETWILIDKADYILGIEPYSDETTEKKAFREAVDKRGVKKFDLFRKENLEFLQGLSSPMATAIMNFLSKWNPSVDCDNDALYSLGKNSERKPRTLKGYCAFVLEGVHQKSYQDPEIREQWNSWHAAPSESAPVIGVCAVTGKVGPIPRLHKGIKLSGPQGKTAMLISVDGGSTAFQSYNKKEGYNSPVSEEIMQKYTAALTYFYQRGSKNKLMLGGDTLIFWAECDTKEYQSEFISLAFEEAGKEESDEDNEEENLTTDAPSTLSPEEATEKKLDSTLKQVRKAMPTAEFSTADDTTFHILILSQNARRLTVRRYLTKSFGDLRAGVILHHEDLALLNQKGEIKRLTVRRLLTATVPSILTAQSNPNYNGLLMDAIFNRTSYSAEMFSSMIQRFKTDHLNSDKKIDRIRFISLTYSRVAFIKAYLVRKARLNNQQEDITMALNVDSKQEGYLLGRLFAVLEKVQGEAIGGAEGPNASIGDRFFASAASSPAAVFPILMTGYKYNIGKDKVRTRVRYERLVEEIFCKMSEQFPPQLDMDGQGRFIIGYYQQRTDLWTSHKVDTDQQ